ncbi:MAG: hypothetical protein ABIC36_03735 [bacterium]
MHTENNGFSGLAEVARIAFCLKLPVTMAELKRAYIKAIEKYNPVIGGNEVIFKNIKTAYDLLTGQRGFLARIFTDKGFKPGTIPVTNQGVPLSELGLGLGLNVSGKDCLVCKHNGYTVTFGSRMAVCNNCDDIGRVPREFQCRDCKSTGKVLQKRSGLVVECRKCNGTTVFIHPRLTEVCSMCGGTKEILEEDPNKAVFHKCWECQGAGEIKIWNALPKEKLLKAIAA